MNFDLTSLSLTQMLVLLSALMIVDVASGIVGSLVGGSFKWAVLPTFLETHVLSRVFPIAGLILLAETIPTSNGAHQLLWGLADAGAAAYLAEVVTSIAGNLTKASVPRTMSGG